MRYRWAVLAAAFVISLLAVFKDDVRMAWAYFGTCGIWAEGNLDPQGNVAYVSTNYNGTSAGRDNAYADLSSPKYGLVRLGAGAIDLAGGFGTIPPTVCVIRPSWQGYDVAGRPLRWFDRLGTQRFRADTLGVNVVGAVKGDSANYPGGIFLGGTKVNKVIQGIFNHDFNPISPGTTLDEVQSVNETGLDAASNWTIVITPQADLPAGVKVEGRVSADNQLKLRAENACNVASADPTLTTFKYMAVK